MKTIRMNWALLLSFACFWCYSFQGAIVATGTLPRLAVTLLLGTLFLGLLWLGLTQKKEVTQIISFERRDGFVLLGLSLFLFPFFWNDLNYSLVGDHLYHSYYSHVHVIKSLRLLAPEISKLNDFPVKTLIRIAALGTLVVVTTSLYLLRRVRVPVQLSLGMILFLAVRSFVEKNGGNLEVHPTFRLFPLWLSSTLLGLSPFSFRLPQFLALIAMAYLIYRFSRSRISEWSAISLALAAATIPVVAHTATLVEPSIWSSLCWTSLLLWVACFSCPKETSSWFALSSAIALASLMRQPSFAIYLPFFFLLFLKTRNLKTWIWAAIPTLAMAPTLAQALIRKTPALAIPPPFDKMGTLERVIFSIQSGTALNLVLNSSLLPWAICALFALFFSLARREKNWGAKLFPLFLFCISFFLFHGIDPNTWGTGRYQAEYVAPFAVLGLFLAFQLAENFSSGKFVARGLALVLVSYNLYIHFQLAALNLPIDQRKKFTNYGQVRVLSQLNYPYETAFREAKAAGFGGEVVLAGVGYGNMSEILYGYTFDEWLRDFRLHMDLVNQKGGRGVFSLQTYQSRDFTPLKNVRLILISDAIDDPQESLDSLIANLKQTGWSEWKNFEDRQFGSSIIGLKRDF